jgi:phage shock protein A
MAETPDPIDGELVEDSTALEVSTPPPVTPAFDYTDAGVPTFDFVRDRIENRVATSVGSQELAGETPEGKAVEDQFEARERAGRDKLEEIRRQMRGE